MALQIMIRAENIADHQQVGNIHRASFPDDSEANLVDALRGDRDAAISLVAEVQDNLVGHIMCSRMQTPFRALGLAPVAVLQDFRKQGIADRLIRAAIAEARTEGYEGMFVLGDPDYYQRFGFNAPDAAGFQSPYAGPYFMALSLQNKKLPVRTGPIEYAPAFSKLA